jgi:endonuclease/exonuclease/phosphatase family metal-dependent hydrolase
LTGKHLQVITEHRAGKRTSILDELRRLDADILLLQEVDRDCRRTEYRRRAIWRVRPG